MDLAPIAVSIHQLLLDPNNLRFSEIVLDGEVEVSLYTSTQAQAEILNKLRTKHQLLGLKESILKNGWLPVDSIVVREYSDTSDSAPSQPENSLFIVVEGNRRVAALKTIYQDCVDGRLRECDLPEGLIDTMGRLPLFLVRGTTEQVRKYSDALMGIRHVTGPKPWGGVQSASLIDRMYNDGKSLTQIADMLGMSAIEAGRRMRGFRAVLQMQEDTEYGSLVLPNHYALLLEAISSPDFKRWIGWEPNSQVFQVGRNLKFLYYLTTGRLPALRLSETDQQASSDIKPVRPQIKNPTSMRTLKKVLQQPNALEVLEDTWDCLAAFDALDSGPTDSITDAARSLLLLLRNRVATSRTIRQDDRTMLADLSNLIIKLLVQGD